MQRQGRLVTVEGIEGAGKTTHVARLAAWLTGAGCAVTQTSEPDGVALGRALRGVLAQCSPVDPCAEMFVFAAARAEHTRRVIRPAVDMGQVVVCDRYADSTTAYQGFGRGVPLELIDTVNDVATDGLRPDLTLLLDLEVAEGLRRARARADRRGAGPSGPPADPFEGLGAEFYERVRKGFLAIHEREPGRVVLVNAAEPRDTVAARIRRIVAERLGIDG